MDVFGFAKRWRGDADSAANGSNTYRVSAVMLEIHLVVDLVCGTMWADAGWHVWSFHALEPHQPHPCPSRSCSGSVYNLSRIRRPVLQFLILAIQAEADETGAPWDHIDAAKPLERAVKEWAVKCDEAPAIRSFGVVAWRCVRCCQTQQLDVGSR